MRKCFKCAISVGCAAVLLLAACALKGEREVISKELGIDVSGGTELSASDSHGGFHGDGTTLIVLSFSDEKAEEKIRENADWKKFPLDETVETLVYGVSDELSRSGPFLCDSDGAPLIPEIQNGYYRLLDRQTEDETAGEEDILHRSSFNFTLGIYDTDTALLYLCKFDT